MKICITGGGGYVGTKLCQLLLKKGHQVTVLDNFWYGDYLHNSVNKVRGDIRSVADLRFSFRHQDAVVHLACISNDPSFDLDKKLGESVNGVNTFKKILSVAREANVKRFIYASSSSVYGCSKLERVTEEAPTKPLTDYSKFKLECEEELKKYGTGGTWTIVRPSTVCGYSLRMRFDLVVNIFAIHALVNKKITITAKPILKRPNIHIDDMCRAYDFILNADEKKIDQQIFNIGIQNETLLCLAHLVKDEIPCEIEIKPDETDNRSYHVCGDKFVDIGFKYRESIQTAIQSIKEAHGIWLFKNPMTNPLYYNIRRMKELGVT